MGVTIKQIAEAADVSRGTVDKVINNRIGVSDEVKERVQRITKELGYKPNIIGKALSLQNRPIIIGIIIPSKKNPFYEEIMAGIHRAHKEFKDFGLHVETRVMESLEETEQAKLLAELKAENVAGVALPVIEGSLVREQLIKLIENKIEVITFNSDMVGIRKLCFVGQDLPKSGRVAAGLMAKLLNGTGKVAIITGSFHMLAHNQRIAGFQDLIYEQHPNIDIVRTIECLDDDEVAYEKTVALFKERKDIDGIYITAAGIKGIGKAIRASKRETIKVVSFDLVSDTISLLEDGIIDFTITQEPFMQGYLPIKIFFDYFFKDKKPKTTFAKTNINIIIKENLDMTNNVIDKL